MRRWVCIVALLAGFSSEDYIRTLRPRMAVPIERPVESMRPALPQRRGLVTAAAWWGRT